MKYPEESKAAFIVCTFSMLGKIAAADGRVSASEEKRIERYMDEELKLDGKTKKLAMKVFHEALDSPLELRDYAEKFKENFPDRLQLLERVVQILLEVSAADGEFPREENSEVRSAALLLGMSDPGFQRLKTKVLADRFANLHLPKS